MRTPLAWKNLTHNKMRTAVAVAGVTFAVVLMFMQLGFLGSIETTVTMIYDALDFDLVLRSRGYLHLSDPRSFDRNRLYQAASTAGVADVVPLYVELNTWQNPLNGRRRAILTMGIRPREKVFTIDEIQRKVQRLTDREYALIDRKSRHEFGPRCGRRFSDADIGQVAEVGGRRIELVGHFELGTGLAADGAILLNQDGFARLLPGRTIDEVSLGLIRLEPRANPEAVAVDLRRRLPEDVDVLRRDEVVRRELDRWIRETSIGVIFQLGVVVVLLVGTAIVFQVLSSDVSSHMPEYATLKAMGYTSGYLCRVVLWQAVLLAVLGYLPGLVLAEGLYRVTSYLSNLPIVNTPGRMLLVAALTVAMCTVSGLGALRKVVTAEPAELF